jgi:hypothetical protein
MLRHAHFDVKGGKRPFAAVSTDDRCADEAATLHFEKNFRYQIMGTFKFGSARKQSAY